MGEGFRLKEAVKQMAKVCLISCVSAKQSRSTRAEDMYISPLFRGARFFAKSRFDRWYILSAKYGLLKPSQLIEPYEKTLKKMPKKERMHWAEKVINAITPCLDTDDVLSFVAGNDYREFLLPYKESSDTIVLNNLDTPDHIIRITQEISADLKKQYCKKD